jgi:hypothetical protein
MHRKVHFGCLGRIVADRTIPFPLRASSALAGGRIHPIWIARSRTACGISGGYRHRRPGGSIPSWPVAGTRSLMACEAVVR